MEIEHLRTIARRQLAREGTLLDFARYIFPEMQVNWHHRVICSYLDRWVSGELTRLMIFAPPRTGKSQLVSRILPAYLFSRRPDCRVIATSYSASLAQKMNRDVQRLMSGPEWAELDLEAQLPDPRRDNVVRNNTEFGLLGSSGGYVCAGVGGPITGVGADYAIVDDPVKNSADAQSSVVQEGLLSWYRSTLFTRLQHPGSVLVMNTRWSPRDLAGRLLEAEGDKWTVVTLPAVAEGDLPPYDPRQPGEALWPDRFPLERLRDIRESVGSKWWASLYQQDPRDDETAIFRRDWLRTYDTLPDLGGAQLMFSADLSFTGGPNSDYVAIQCWAKVDTDYFLLDQIRGRFDFVRTQQALEEMRSRWPHVRTLLLEQAANGAALGSVLRRDARGLRVIPYRPDKNKVLRYYAAQPLLEQGRVHIPRSAPWIQEYIEELTEAAGDERGNVVGVQNDDQIDATVQALLHWSARSVDDPRDNIRLGQMALGVRR